MSILQSIYTKIADGRKQLAYLLDPDKYQGDKLDKAIGLIGRTRPDLVMVGGSLVQGNTAQLVETLKRHIPIPVILYPGSLLQLAPQADGILFISLISGRNPEFLIGNHVVVAPILRQTNIEVIPTGYMLVDGGNVTSVQYMSNTMPIPPAKTDIAVATALAGQYLGMKMIYMDGGSGALNPIPPAMISEVKGALDIPLIIGGGLNTPEKVASACNAGADLLVIGNAVEKDPSLLAEFKSIIDKH
ncbi:MAG: geranylgeranylglyceryl/heptaprenylglyceryl phosphate synthase [Breznakibacter sp.]